jgi:hypothetical protein
MRHLRAVALVALTLVASGCRVGCEDVEILRAVTAPGFGVTETGAPGSTGVLLAGDVHYTQRDVRDFRRIFDILYRRARDERSVAFTLHGYETPPGDRITLTLAIPAGARQGERYRVAGAFVPPAPWIDEWVLRPSVAAGEVEVGFKRSRPAIPDPPYNYTPTYTATGASGSIDVLRRENGLLELQLDFTVTDGAGRGYRVAGRTTVTAVSEGEVCFSPS